MSSVLDLIDSAIEDWATSGDAMRWRPKPPQAEVEAVVEAAIVDAVLARPARRPTVIRPPLGAGPYPWARDIPGEFRHRDYHPPTGDWPGGDRFGWRRERVMAARTYTDEERELAERYGIELPLVDWSIRETWWDLPARTVIRRLAPLSFRYDDPMPVATPMDTVTYDARRYAEWWWQTDPLANVRRLAGLDAA